MNTEYDVLFAFDDLVIEATRGVKLEMMRPEKYPGNPILERGNNGQFDETSCGFCSVICDEGLWRMWYVANSGNWYESLVGYAESDDGITWRKPELGLYEYKGSLKNNIISAVRGMGGLSVICDKEAPPEYRYVMAGQDMSWYAAHINNGKGWTLDPPCPFTRIDVSPDGFRWKPIKNEPGILQQMIEPPLIYRFGGKYHIGGQQVSPLLRIPMSQYPESQLGPRTFVVCRSPRIDRWPLEYTTAFYKPMCSSSPYLKGWDGEQVHVGATVTAYRNVCLGVYGQWHRPIIFEEDEPKYQGGAVHIMNDRYIADGDPENDSAVSVDLGLIISNDGLHFREPAPGFTFVSRDQELRWDRDYRDNNDKNNILLLQGSMINADRLTHIYYTASTPHGNTDIGRSNIGLATLPRDRFGYISLIDENTTGQFVSCNLHYKQNMKLYVNVDVPVGSALQVYLLDEHGLDVLQGYDKSDGGQIRESGLDIEVVWGIKHLLPKEQPFKIRCEIKGETKVFALYLKGHHTEVCG